MDWARTASPSFGQAAAVDDQSGISAADLIKAVGTYDALVIRGRTRVTPEVFEAASRLTVIGRLLAWASTISIWLPPRRTT